MRRAWPLLLFLLAVPATGAAQCLQGSVGVRDAGGVHPLQGVGISDGRQLATSGLDGRWTLQSPLAGPVFMIKPAGHGVPMREDGLPDFWRPGTDGRGCDFELEAAAGNADGPLEVLVFSDSQTADMREVGYYRDAIVAPLAGSHGARLGLSLGDITNDDPSLYPALIEATTTLDVPWLHVAGNHDLDFDAGSDRDSLRSFHQAYGPDTFAWEEDQAVFVGLDNVVYRPDGGSGYTGGLREDQFEFLEAWLPTLSADRLVVVMVHIPLFNTSAERETFRAADRERLFRLLQRFPKVLVLSGHRHQLQHVFHGPDSGWHGEAPLHEFNVGAASGAFWSGAAGDDGIPDATMSDGTPNGHARLVIDGDGAYRLSWHRAGHHGDDDPGFTDAMSLHAPRSLRRGAYPAWGIYANVYMGLEDTRVEFRVGEGEWRPMRKVAAPDPRLVVENVRDDLATELRGFDRSPEAVPSTHLWRGALPTGLEEGEHRIEVRAFDLWQGEQRASTRYRLIEAKVEP
ncbi:calcineurin-like phosphoesterase C-terminal domain-containing protein [Luteimonas dalianensis]|uniref:calcineurin-like phosphoesterase C-terminal domain-containing protein n=1 Tax=Luteimonas dalianensis TaxID=1148196 RepID=UPI003BF26499